VKQIESKLAFLLEWLSSALHMQATCYPKRRLLFNGLHGGISQKITLKISFFFFTVGTKTIKISSDIFPSLLLFIVVFCDAAGS
jgi:hypothetical protein